MYKYTAKPLYFGGNDVYVVVSLLDLYDDNNENIPKKCSYISKYL